jgi:hypothetical protein
MLGCREASLGRFQACACAFRVHVSVFRIAFRVHVCILCAFRVHVHFRLSCEYVVKWRVWMPIC